MKRSRVPELAPVSTGIPELDRRLGGGLRPGGIAVYGPAYSGKRVFCLQVLFKALMEGLPGVYGAADRNFKEIREISASYGWDLGRFNENQFVIIDSCSATQRTVPKLEKGVEFIERGSPVSAYRDSVVKLTRQVGRGGVHVADSLNGLMLNLRGGPAAIVDMARGFRQSLTKLEDIVALHVLHESGANKPYIEEIMSFQNRVIYMEKITPGGIFRVRIAETDFGVDTGWLTLKQTDEGMAYVARAEMEIDQEPSLEHSLRAIELSEKCQPEDERTHPKVGAVLIKDGKIIGEAFRGEIKDGEHAEYTLLERKCVHKDVRGATLITTLEPCTTRTDPKKPCSTHIVKRGIRRVIIGMLDPDPRVSGQGEMFLLRHNVAIDHFPAHLKRMIWKLNKDYIDQHSSTE